MALPEHDPENDPKPGDQVPQHVKDNYTELHAQGRSWESMADQAEAMNDRALAAHLRGEAQGGDRGKAPVDRSATPKSTQTTKAGGAK